MTFNTDTFLPPVLAVGAQSVQNGRNQLGSGLITHKGIIDVNCLRATGALYPQHGAGLEVVYNQASVPKRGVIQSYDRDAAAYTDLNIVAANVNLIASGGKVSLPAGTAQSLIGQYRTATAWAVPAINTWYESSAQASFTSTGGVLRVEYMASFTGPTAGSAIIVGCGYDGAVQGDSVNVVAIPVTNGIVTTTGIAYFSSVTAGLHRMSIWVYANVAGVTFHSWAYQTIWVTEQRA